MPMQAEPDFFITSYFFLTFKNFSQRYLSKHEEATASSCLNVATALHYGQCWASYFKK